MPDGLSRKQKRELRELQGLAWERELNEALRSLREDFAAWEKGDLSPFELSDQIHEFHNGRSRELFSWYSGGMDVWLIAHAIAKGVIEESELSGEVRAELADDIATFRERWQGEVPETDSEQ